jgi:hypothetical protein
VTQVLAVGLTLLLLALFSAFGGFWSQEPLDKSSLFREVAEMLSIMEAASPQARPSLAASASTGYFHLDWYPGPSPVADFFEVQSRTADSEFEQRVHALTHHLAVAIDAGSRLAVPSTLVYDRSRLHVDDLGGGPGARHPAGVFAIRVSSLSSAR